MPDVELLIITYQEGERRQPLMMPNHTGTRVEDLTDDERHDLVGRLQRTIWQFEEELRHKRQRPQSQ